MRIGTVAERSGVSAKTIRYYEEVGLLPMAERAENGYRHYGQKDVEVLKFVQRARKLGFAVKDVESLLALWRDRDRASASVRELAKEHVAEINHRIEELESMRSTLTNLIHRCHGDDRPDCPILDNLAGQPASDNEEQRQ